MPNGYTYQIYDGEQQFEDFMKICLESFIGNSNRKTELEEDVEYYESQLQEIRFELEKFNLMPWEDKAALWEASFQEQVAEFNKMKKDAYERKLRYRHMIETTKKWKEDTDDLFIQELKKFMIKQLEASIENDCELDEGVFAPKKVPLAEFIHNKYYAFELKLSRCTKELDIAKKQLDKYNSIYQKVMS